MEKYTIYTVELNHKRANLETREVLSIDPENVKKTLKQFKDLFNEIFILATCNRFAFYCYGNNIDPLLEFFDSYNIDRELLYIHETDVHSARHLFRTATGLESQIIGEQQILGQIKRAHQLAKEVGTIGPILDEFVREAVRVSKKARLETKISRYSTSAASASLQIITNMFGNLLGKAVLIIGTGKIASIVLSLIKKTNVSKVIVASHDIERAKLVANKLNVEAISIQQIPEVFPEVDIVLGGTHKEVKFWTNEQLKSNSCPKEVFGMFNEKKRLFIDLGVPRNFNPELRRVPNAYLFDMDHIAQVKDDALEKRMEAVPEVVYIIEGEVEKYLKKLKHRKMSLVYESYWKQLEEIKKQNLHWLKPKLNEDVDQQWDLIERYTHKLIRQVGRTPIKGIRSMVAEDKLNGQALQAINEIHNLNLNINKNGFYTDDGQKT